MPIPGATLPTLQLRDIKASDAARYSVAVTNPSGGVASNAAMLVVK
jgi:hypothetical protein